jgi:hypothetical protein
MTLANWIPWKTNSEIEVKVQGAPEIYIFFGFIPTEGKEAN